VTWVHSSTGVKLPIRRFASALEELNRKRGDADRILLCVDGVHGFGVERESPLDLGCDFFAAGCHKWIFGPRGTGVLWGRPSAWKGHIALIASFERAPYEAWMKGQIPSGPPGPMASPGGFIRSSTGGRWGGLRISTSASAGHGSRLASTSWRGQCKEGLAQMPHVKLHTAHERRAVPLP